MKTEEFIQLLIQAPLAIILMYFMYRVLKMYGELLKEITKMLKHKKK